MDFPESSRNKPPTVSILDKIFLGRTGQPIRSPSGGQEDLLTGEPLLENKQSTPILQAQSGPPTLQALLSPPPLQNMESTPLQPTPAGILKGQSLARKPPNVGHYIDEIRLIESNRNLRIADMMARDGDYESQIGFDDRYKLVPSSEGDDTSSEEAEVDHKHTTITVNLT